MWEHCVLRAVLHSLDSPDIGPSALDTFVPPIPSEFVIVVQAEIGPAGSNGGELFDLVVCSPEGLAKEMMAVGNANGFSFLRHRLVLERWDPSLIRRAIGDLCRNTTGVSWSEVATKLARYMHWEFEGYTPAAD